MTVALWRIAKDTSEFTADDRRGIGSSITGARWNRPGTPMVYSSPSIALACLETVVHFNAVELPLNRYLVRIDVPDDVWATREVVDPAVTVGWDAIPAGKVSMDRGVAWAEGMTSLLLVVPSIVIPQEWNVLINPAHPDEGLLTYTKQSRFTYDPRLRS